MTIKRNVAVLAVLALLIPCYLSAPRHPRDTGISCSEGSHLSSNCPLTVPLANCLKGNRNLWLIMCGSRVVQQLAKGVCFNLSTVSGPTHSVLLVCRCLPQLMLCNPSSSSYSQRANECMSSKICLQTFDGT